MSEYPGITQDEYKDRWRRELKDAVDAALAEVDDEDPRPITIFVRKRRDNPVHDYKVDLGGP
jgi:hypothetical protein